MRTRIGLVSGLALVLGAAAFAAAPVPAYKVIVNPKSAVTSLPREKVAAYFLKKSTSWDDGSTVQPVDQPDDSAARKSFSQEVLKKSVSAVKAYWQQRIFSGRDLPPLERGTDEEVIAYVRGNDRAIGYVSGSADTSGVKVVQVNE